jgi:hypothetical protein
MRPPTALPATHSHSSGDVGTSRIEEQLLAPSVVRGQLVDQPSGILDGDSREPSFDPYALRFSGTLPPLSATLIMTCLCSQVFISAEPSSAPA